MLTTFTSICYSFFRLINPKWEKLELSFGPEACFSLSEETVSVLEGLGDLLFLGENLALVSTYSDSVRILFLTDISDPSFDTLLEGISLSEEAL